MTAMPKRSTFIHGPFRTGWRLALGITLGLGLQFAASAQALATGPIAEERGPQRAPPGSSVAPSPEIDPAHVQPAAPTLGGGALAPQLQALERLRAQASTTRQGKTAQRDAAWMLGLVLLHGSGAPADPAAAHQWFKRAHELGHPLAAAGLAWCALDGCTGAPRPIEAAPWIAQLRRSDPARATYFEWLRAKHMAPLQRSSRAPAADSLLARAAASGNPAAQVEYGLALLEHGQRSAALRLFRQAAARSPAAAANAEWLQAGESASTPVNQNLEQSAQWLAQARRYHRGDGVPANYTEALRLYQRAANAGNAEARRMLQTIYSRPGPGGGIDIAWMQQLARLNLDAAGQAVPGTLAGVHAFARDPTPLYDLLPAQWR